MTQKYIALLPAAGVGSRFGAPMPKQYVAIANKPVLQHTIDLFAQEAQINHIAVIISAEDTYFDTCIKLPENAKVYRVGGETRAQTVANGVNELLQLKIAQEKDLILVHDAARCCLPATALKRIIQAATFADGALLAIPVADTLKRQNAQQCSEETVSRSHLWQAQTPQVFQAAVLQQALAQAKPEEITDEASAVEQLGLKPLLVEGDSRNFKLTRPDDAILATLLLQEPINQNKNG